MHSGAQGDEIAFVGSASYDLDGEIVSWVWDFGDGSTGSGEIVTHVYPAEGVYMVTLCVTDDEELESCCTTTVTIEPSVPTEKASWGTVKQYYR